MSDRMFLRLSETWALGYDKNQWIVMKRRKRQDEPYWQPVSFIGSHKTNLLRVLTEKGVTVDSEAMGVIDTMPEKFLDWYAAISSPTTSELAVTSTIHSVAQRDEVPPQENRPADAGPSCALEGGGGTAAPPLESGHQYTRPSRHDVMAVTVGS
jgi:hypothetical protein